MENFECTCDPFYDDRRTLRDNNLIWGSINFSNSIYSGELCDIDICKTDKVDCGNGVCIPNGDKSVCVCASGWEKSSGSQSCDVPVSRCEEKLKLSILYF